MCHIAPPCLLICAAPRPPPGPWDFQFCTEQMAQETPYFATNGVTDMFWDTTQGPWDWQVGCGRRGAPDQGLPVRRTRDAHALRSRPLPSVPLRMAAIPAVCLQPGLWPAPSGSSHGSLLPHSAPHTQAVVEHCNATWGRIPEPGFALEAYGGLEAARHTSNIAFSNVSPGERGGGEGAWPPMPLGARGLLCHGLFLPLQGLLDPWSAFGIMENVSDTVVAIIIPEVSSNQEFLWPQS